MTRLAERLERDGFARRADGADSVISAQRGLGGGVQGIGQHDSLCGPPVGDPRPVLAGSKGRRASSIAS